MKQLTLRPRVAAAPLRTRRPTNTDVLLLVHHREATSFVNFLTKSEGTRTLSWPNSRNRTYCRTAVIVVYKRFIRHDLIAEFTALTLRFT